MIATALSRIPVEKPWGVEDIAADFGVPEAGKIGEIWFDDGKGDLELLVKWLFTSEKLSIQVHPNDDQAKARGLASGKEECWFVVDAQVDGCLGIGTRKEMSSEQLRTAALDGSLEDKMVWHPVKSGDWFHIPPGTVHAIGAGVTIIEVQQFADITYRLFDYGRPRELHLDDAVDVAEAKPLAANLRGHYTAESGPQLIVDSQYFQLFAVSNVAEWQAPIQSPTWIIPVHGTARADGRHIDRGDCLFGRFVRLELEEGAMLLVAIAKPREEM